MASGDIKGFYRQRKKGGVTKPSPTPSSKRKAASSSPKATAVHAASLAGPDPVQPAALVTHTGLDLKDSYSADEEALRQFDMDMKYGPCIGMTRMRRWERAAGMGLNPPGEVAAILRSSAGGGGTAAGMECLWEGRV